MNQIHAIWGLHMKKHTNKSLHGLTERAPRAHKLSTSHLEWVKWRFEWKISRIFSIRTVRTFENCFLRGIFRNCGTHWLVFHLPMGWTWCVSHRAWRHLSGRRLSGPSSESGQRCWSSWCTWNEVMFSILIFSTWKYGFSPQK